MKKVYLHAKNRSGAVWKKTTSKQPKALTIKMTPKAKNEPTGRRIENVQRVNPEVIHAQRVAFNQEHFGCKKFYHQNGEKSWIVPVSKKETPAVTVKRILQILVPSNFYYHTDKMRKKTVYKRDERRRVLSIERIDVPIVAHGERAVKAMLLKVGVDKDSIMTNKNVCYVTLHKAVTEEKVKELFPTLHMRVFKVRN